MSARTRRPNTKVLLTSISSRRKHNLMNEFSEEGKRYRIRAEKKEVKAMETCVFCDIVAGKAPASFVYEDEVVCAFLTIGPVNPGHVLVIPKQHFPFLSDLSEET